MTYLIYVMCGVSLLQCLALAVLLKRRRDVDVSRVEARLAHLGEALALLTDTTQGGFATVAAELEGAGKRRAPAGTRVATSKRIATAAGRGRSIQDIAADEEVSESEVRLHLGMMHDATATATAVSAPKAPARATGPVGAVRPAPPARPRASVAKPLAAAVVHDAAARPKGTSRRRGHVLNLGA